MAKYDGTVLMNTKIDTEGVKKGSEEMESRLSSASSSLSDIANTAKSLSGQLSDALRIDGIEGAEEAEEDIKKAAYAVEYLSERLKKLRDSSLDFGDEEYDEVYTALVKAKKQVEEYKKSLVGANKEQEKVPKNKYDETRQELVRTKKQVEEYKKSLAETNRELNKLSKSSENTEKKLKKTNEKLADTEKNSKKAHKGMSMLGMLGRSVLFSFVFKAISAISTGVKEGMQNLAQYSGETNKTLSSLMSSLTQLKNSFATAFSPILSVVAPVLTKLINLLSTAMTYIGQFFSALTGKGTFTKAVSVQQDYASSLNSTAKAAKKAAGALYAFDELNVVQSADEDSGTAGAVSPSQMFADTEIDPKVLQWVENLKVLFEPVIEAFGRVKEAAKPLIETIGQGLLWFYNNVLAPFARWTISEVLPRFLDLIAGALRILNAVIQAVAPYLKWLWDEFLHPIAQFTGGIILSVLDGLIWAFQEIANWLEQDASSWTFLMSLFKVAGAILLGPIKLLTQLVNILLKDKQMIDNLKLAFRGLLTFLSGVFSGDFEKILNGLKDMVKGIVNGIITLVETGINFIIDKINSLSFDVPDWVPVIGGEHFGFAIRKITLPRLATGTVVPPRAGEFAAILGDNNRETEVVSPLSTMRQAMREELESMGGYGGQVNIIAEGDVDQLIRFFRFKIQQENNRTGVNLTKVVTT